MRGKKPSHPGLQMATLSLRHQAGIIQRSFVKGNYMKSAAGLAIIWVSIVIAVTGCALESPDKIPGFLSPDVQDVQVEIIDAFCTYGESAEFPFRFTLKNLEHEDIEVTYYWTLNEPMADNPGFQKNINDAEARMYQGAGGISLTASGTKEIEIQVKPKIEYDPRFFVMYVYVYRDHQQVGFYRAQKSTFDWDYSVIPPVERVEQPPYKHIWIDTFVEKTVAGYRVNIDGILFLPAERTARLDLSDISISFDTDISMSPSLKSMLSESSGLFGMRFYDTDNNGELSVGDYFSTNNIAEGKTFKLVSRDNPSIHIYGIGYSPEAIKEENRNAIKIQGVTYKVIDEKSLEVEVKVVAENPLEHVDAELYVPGEGGVASSSAHLEPPVADAGGSLVFRKVIETSLHNKGEPYLLIFITDGTNEVLFHAGKMPG